MQIECFGCSSRNCEGCNIYILATMLRKGELDCLMDEHHTIARTPESLRAKGEWISVEDRLPTIEDANETESILAIHKDEKYVGRWLWDIVAEYPTEFTHWMPLPEPPKGD